MRALYERMNMGRQGVGYQNIISSRMRKQYKQTSNTHGDINDKQVALHGTLLHHGYRAKYHVGLRGIFALSSACAAKTYHHLLRLGRMNFSGVISLYGNRVWRRNKTRTISFCAR